ncbi:DUF3043 domain-containing protein [Microbacterium sp. zg.Y1090]|uniref:DUF3043 domain-containing protein n=1 Tax=Microbacterium TaxID=33882 RepID=UPI00214C3695|nr:MULTISPECIES: DUF3043 domain-containing protein [unclassified Microbacterium]MCR2811452.1 DUF3043 domain-containing protein [Microbacterium sp. zg.Y1084]MCR2819129.1 DUF3043 domain-containing protein [Microbacterium sp. zg.Y1090]MDL5487872.1 DUF3043 domain-containing protein [Microbacterium sp. zg-Y1211]WIM27431.1 DUF3043 domain-containing protein [Microbacterium sp. zg-Y1090]
MANTPTPAPKDSSLATPTEQAGPGKGRPTPSRAEREAARKRPLVADTKEARARAKAELAAAREKARVGMANGEDRYLPARDKGPQRKFARDFVDAGWHLGEAVMPMMLLVIVLTFIPIAAITYWSFVGLWIFIMFVIGDMIITSIRVKKAAKERFGAARMEKGLGWYAAMRTIQMRFMRLPKPQVKRGQHP